MKLDEIFPAKERALLRKTTLGQKHQDPKFDYFPERIFGNFTFLKDADIETQEELEVLQSKIASALSGCHSTEEEISILKNSLYGWKKNYDESFKLQKESRKLEKAFFSLKNEELEKSDFGLEKINFNVDDFKAEMIAQYKTIMRQHFHLKHGWVFSTYMIKWLEQKLGDCFKRSKIYEDEHPLLMDVRHAYVFKDRKKKGFKIKWFGNAKQLEKLLEKLSQNGYIKSVDLKKIMEDCFEVAADNPSRELDYIDQQGKEKTEATMIEWLKSKRPLHHLMSSLKDRDFIKDGLYVARIRENFFYGKGKRNFKENDFKNKGVLDEKNKDKIFFDKIMKTINQPAASSEVSKNPAKCKNAASGEVLNPTRAIKGSE